MTKKIYVIKVGGNIIDDEVKLAAFLKSFALCFSNKPAILVHGGGKLATSIGNKLGIKSKYVSGRRITDAETLKIVTMVYAGYINKNIVAQLQSYGCNAIGLSGADGNLIQAHKRVKVSHVGGDLEGAIDFGFAGDIDNIDTSLLQNLLKLQLTPVIATVTHDKKGQLLNTNADTIAQEIAQALSAYYKVHLIYCFEKAGVLLNVEDEQSVIASVTFSSYKNLKEQNVIYAGMIPKLDNAFAALNKGVTKVTIGKAEQLEQLLEGNAGTIIVHD